MKNCYFAVDLGATSGRTVLGSFADGELKLEEINRFPNQLIGVQGHYFWDIYELYRQIIEGLRIVASRRIKITSIGIDTWGVDFVLVGEDGHFLRQPYSYRDPHTMGAPERFYRRISSGHVYKLTGLQVMNCNSLFQLDTLRRNDDSALAAADKILFLPDALSYMLTDEMVCEYTIASTSQLVNAKTRRFEPEMLQAVGLTEDHFGRFVYPGEKIGVLSREARFLTGLSDIPVIAVAGHDTASAVAAIPALNDDFAYLSSGTWSIMGVESKEPVINMATEVMNYTNEGGVGGTVFLQKNGCGLWLLERLRGDWGGETSYPKLIAEARKAEPFRSLVCPDAEIFDNPPSMEMAIQRYCKKTRQPVPETQGQFVRCIFESLAISYRESLSCLRAVTSRPLSSLHVIGGGSRNKLLNQFTANSTGATVTAGPPEATSIGNVMVQAMAAGAAPSIAEMRKIIHQSVPLTTYKPRNSKQWEDGYHKYLCVRRNV